MRDYPRTGSAANRKKKSLMTGDEVFKTINPWWVAAADGCSF
ncbi:hypothetical protein CFter6_1490 [Collimonas fungivorans]|uniref:Uncharacterized protein n=1 Tax=Collimonas fungivorans TaxID=158899 RepID=A0A127P978_9BURK|nr:hypothetical protein CFter6_1490 [Collimonas fungivorans]